MQLSSKAVRDGASEYVLLYGTLGGGGGGAASAHPLVLRHLTVEKRMPRAARSPVGAGISKRQRASGDQTGRSSYSSTRAGRGATRAAGVVFGSTLKSVLQYAGVPLEKRQTRRALRQIARFLDPVAAAVCRIEGDREPLACGLLALHVVPAQCRALAESREPAGGRSYIGRAGVKDVAVGVTVAVLAAHYVAAHSGANVETIATALDNAVSNARWHLQNWRHLSGSGEHMHVSAAALRAEVRALDRARAGAHAAVRQAQLAGLDQVAALRLQLETMRQAVFPPGVRCDANSHAALCDAIAKGSPVGDAAVDSQTLQAPVPLSAIPCDMWMQCGDDGSDAGSASVSSASSVASSFSSGQSDSGDGVLGMSVESNIDLASVVSSMGVL